MKKITKLLLSGLVLLAAAFPVFAEENSDWDCNSTALGTSASFIPEHTIYGLNYQHWWDNFGLDVTVGGYFNNSYSYSDSYLCVGVKPQFQVYKTDPSKKHMAKVYIWGLAGCTGQINNPYNYGDSSTKKSEYVFDGIAGVGFGTEVICWNHLSLPIEVGLAGGIPNSPAFGFCSSFGLRFRF